jgi:5-(carboxyamino)imidazole ribonucleotide synthase
MTVILPGATLGVMGGGQLGRMFVHAAQRMGYFTAVLDPDPASPAGLVSHYHIQTNYLDEQGLAQLMQRSAAITTEFENVPAPALVTLGAHRPVAPGAEAVAIAQDRGQEKAHFGRCGVPCAPYTLIETPEHLAAAKAELLPGVLKTSRLGYDGKGQVRVRNLQELQAAWDDLKRVPCVLEKLLPLAAECSVIVARGHDGHMVHLPPQLNRHRGGILAVTEVYPECVPAAQARHAVTAAKAIAEGLGYIGVLCIEFFVLDDGSLAVNEMAPRPHNSGHYSMDACDVSQFELQVRALAGLPLPLPRQHSPAIMLNLLGDLWFRSETERTPPWDQLLALAGAHLHLYGKLSPRKGRKMGHLTLTGPSVEAVRATAMKAAGVLGIEPF